MGWIGIGSDGLVCDGMGLNLCGYNPISYIYLTVVRINVSGVLQMCTAAHLAYAKLTFRFQIELWRVRGAPRYAESGLVVLRSAFSQWRYCHI